MPTPPAKIVSIESGPPAEAHVDRIAALDGLRGVAIMMVVAYHTWACWSDYIPWVTIHADFPLFRFGHLGVQLFFMISGFVILMTLERCRSFGAFIWRRWLRLFPAMLMASILIYFSARLLPDRPPGVPRLIDMLPGLLLIGPELCGQLLHTQLYLPERPFWSLFVEVKFYIFFGFLWFVRADKAITIFTIVYIASSLYHIAVSIEPHLALFFPSNGALRVLNHIVFNKYYGWFAIGAVLYRQWKRTRGNYTVHSLSEIILLMFLIILSIMDLNNNFSVLIPALLIVALFWLTLFNRHVASLLSRQPFTFMGFISYPLYLIHEKAMVSLTIKTHQFFPTMPGMLTPLPGLILIGLVAWLIAHFGEPRLRDLIRASVGRVSLLRNR